MSEQRETAIATTERKPEIAMTPAGLALTKLDEALRFARYVKAAGIAPADDTPETILVKIQAGAEVGLTPLQAYNAFDVVKGRLGMRYQAILAKCRASGVFRRLKPYTRGTGETMEGVVEFERADTGESDTVTYTVADAKLAGSWGKRTRSGEPTPWVTHPGDMLLSKAVQRFNKRYASDVTMGFPVAETLDDAQDERPAPRVVETTALPAPTESDPLLDPVEDAPYPPSVGPTDGDDKFEEAGR